MAPNIVENIRALTKIPTNVTASNGTSASNSRDIKEQPEHHEEALTLDNTYPESTYPADYVEYHYTRYPNRWSRIRYVYQLDAAQLPPDTISVVS